jgi:carbamoyltransferase
MYILSIHGNLGKAEHDPAAILTLDNKIVAAAEEERFIRYKHAVGLMPDRAIQYCLDSEKISMKEVDLVTFPRSTWEDFDERFKAYLWYNFGHVPPIEYIDHHTAHAASSFYISGFPSALIITLDQSGDGLSGAVFRGSKNKIEIVDTIPFPHSLGLFAAFITQYLGFRSNHDEYKVMGLSAYGRPNIDLSKIITFKKGDLWFNHDVLHPEVMKRHPVFHTDQLPMFNTEKYTFLPHRRLRGGKLTQGHKDLAASAQKVIEDAVLCLVKKYKKADDHYLCLAGGVSENSVVNGKLSSTNLFKDVYISPASSDAGSALGAGLYAATKRGFKFGRADSNKWGLAYSNDQILKLLLSYKIKYRFSDNIEEDVARLLQQQKIVAWFQGRMEFGPRALGARSLLADPSNPEMKDRVNKIKKREEFRPFAPSVLDEQASLLFDTYQASPFMSFTLSTTKIGKQKLISATHVDFTSRLHTVKKDNSRYRKLIDNFYKLSGIPAVLNTSLNSSWEPIVESPDQALGLFFSSETDILALGNYIISKHG